MCDKEAADGRERRKTGGTDLKTRAPHSVVGKKVEVRRWYDDDDVKMHVFKNNSTKRLRPRVVIKMG